MLDNELCQAYFDITYSAWHAGMILSEVRMSQPPTQDEVFSAALALEPDAREQLAERLLSSLSDSTDEPLISQSWADELDRRLAAVKDGTADLEDAASVFRNARAKLRSK